jgi:hypothetical protein
MITMIYKENGPHVECKTRGIAVYLDNFAFIDFALYKPALGKRFIEVVRSGADVLFSVTNLVELGELQGNSLEKIRSFLADIKNCWFPAELDVIEIAKREKAGWGDKTFISQQFVRDFFAFKIRQIQSPTSSLIVVPGEESFSLEGFLDWATPQRDSLREGKAQMDAVLKKVVEESRKKYEQNPTWLDTKYPILPFNKDFRGSFVCGRLLRGLILESKSHALKPGDGIDLSHAVIAAGFSSGGTLDTGWKRRIDNIAGPHELAPIYTSNELDEFVTQAERGVEAWRRPRSCRQTC